MTARLPRCRTCAGPLFAADILVNAETCVECERKAIRLAVDPWATFLRTVKAKVRSDGSLHIADVRPELRGRIEPKVISTCWRRARTLGLVREIGTERSDDTKGKNAGRHEPVYRWTGDAA